MRWTASLLAVAVLVAAGAAASPKGHVITFGTPTQVSWFVGAGEETQLKLKVRPLYVDGRLREFTTGEPRDVTDRSFVVRRAYRINDRLPSDSGQAPKWKWQRGGWLLVDRLTGRVSQLNLANFDPFYSTASWYRDYVAYCGLSDDVEKLYAMVVQVAVKKPIVKRELGRAQAGNLPDSECDAPAWQRAPVRVTFATKDGQKVTFAIHRQSAEVEPQEEVESEK